jgi:hypothetical protein
VYRITRRPRERPPEFSDRLPSLLERLGISMLHRNTDFPTFNGGADLNELAPDRGGPFLKHGRNITPLADDRDIDDVLFIQRLGLRVLSLCAIRECGASGGLDTVMPSLAHDHARRVPQPAADLPPRSPLVRLGGTAPPLVVVAKLAMCRSYMVEICGAALICVAG